MSLLEKLSCNLWRRNAEAHRHCSTCGQESETRISTKREVYAHSWCRLWSRSPLTIGSCSSHFLPKAERHTRKRTYSFSNAHNISFPFRRVTIDREHSRVNMLVTYTAISTEWFSTLVDMVAQCSWFWEKVDYLFKPNLTNNSLILQNKKYTLCEEFPLARLLIEAP